MAKALYGDFKKAISEVVVVSFFFPAPQYTKCCIIVSGLDLLSPLLYLVGWMRPLTVLVVIFIAVALVWRLKDAESIPQVELKLLSHLKYSRFLCLFSS